MTDEPIWKPSASNLNKTNLTAFQDFVNKKYQLNNSTYSTLHDWSISFPSDFWTTVIEFTELIYEGSLNPAINNNIKMSGVDWFPNMKLNFAQNLLRNNSDNIAIESHREDGVIVKISYKELNRKVISCTKYLKSIGVLPGDRVAAIIPNIAEAITLMLASVNLGAIWTSSSPDFGEDAILERFLQVSPKILVTSDGYTFKGKYFSIDDKVSRIAQKLDSVEKIISINYIEQTKITDSRMICYSMLEQFVDIEEHKTTLFDFNHPLYIMYSSGTTGKPKSIVHSSGGTLLQHMKELSLHTNLKEGDKIFYYTTCGWMMWNWLVSSLCIGATVVLYDGNPFYPSPDRLLDIASKSKINIFGTSAKYIDSLKALSIKPSKVSSFPDLQAILSTGSPLTDDSYDYVYSDWKKDVQLSSISGGTDIISCFALGNPNLPVYRGELQCLGLGMDVKSYNNNGESVVSDKGELVCVSPFPSMPIYFWNDENGKKFENTYFSKFNNIWTHGDFISINERGGIRIFGRSDATLNPGGVRIGTAEIYKVVEQVNGIIDSVAVGKRIDSDERIILFVKMKEEISEQKISLIKKKLKEKCSPKHIPYKIIRVEDIPYTLNGKKIELAVKNLINNEEVLNESSIVNPESLEYFKNISI